MALNVTLYWLPASNRSSKTRSVGGARAKRGWRKSVQSGLTDLPTGSPTARGRHDGRSPPTTRGARPWPRTVWSTQSERHSPVIRNAHSPSVTVHHQEPGRTIRSTSFNCLNLDHDLDGADRGAAGLRVTAV